MHKRKIATLTMAIIMSNFSYGTINVLANEINIKNSNSEIQTFEELNKALISKFDLQNNSNIENYNKVFKIDNSKITSITNNGGKYGSSNIEKAIDNDLKTHWETGKPNSKEFTNEVVISLDEITSLNRIVYSARQDGNRGKGFAKEVEIYSSLTDEGDDFKLVGTGSYSGSVSDLVEIRFNTSEFKRIKFKFKNADRDWASASEFMLYKEDTVSDKMNRLFVDSSMKEVSPEFSTTSSLDLLKEEVKGHPFEEEFVSKIDIAKEIISFGKIESSTANVKLFEPFYTDYISSYDEKFRVSNSNILSVVNNAGHYGSSVIANATDNDANSHWETSKPNSNSFKNEVVITLDNPEIINRLTYKSRVGTKGFAEKFSVYVSPVSQGDNFQKISEGSCSPTNDMIEIKFKPTKAKRVKFVFEKAKEDWASISDIRLYKEDSLSEKMEKLFTSSLMDTVSEEFNSTEKINELEQEAKNHPLYPIFKEDIDNAKDIISGKIQTVKTVTVEQQGDRVKHAKENLKIGFGNNNQPTGVVAKPGDLVTVYVDVEEGKPLPSLTFSQQEGSFSQWGRTVNLKPGKNVITVPEISQNGYNHSVTKGGPVYIVNPYTEEQQGKAPTIRFASGVEAFPYFDKNTNKEEFLKLLKEYKQKVDEDVAKNPDVLDREVVDTFEIVSDHIVITGTATSAYEAYVNQNFDPNNTIKMYNDHMKLLFDYQGIDGRNEKNDAKYIRENIRLAQPFGYMYAASNHIGVQSDALVNLLTSVGGWGVDHEIGHKMDIGVRTVGEVTNNMLPQYSSYYYNDLNTRIPFEENVYKNVISTNNNKYMEGGHFERLGVYWQLEMVYPGYWAKLNSLYRENDVTLEKGNEDNDKMDKLAYYSSEALKLNLSEFFERHGFYVSDSTKNHVSKYEKPEKKIWYANYDYIQYKGEGFSNDLGLEVLTLKSGDNVKLEINIDENSKKDLLGYEIYRNGDLIGFTSDNVFVDSEANYQDNITYKIVPFDKKLNEGKSVEVNSHKPYLQSQQDKITIKLKEEFNPLDYINAYNYKGEDISSNVVVNSSVDTSKKGNYKVEYKLEDNGLTINKVVDVEIVSDSAYLSDYEWKSVDTEYGTPRRNTNIKGRVNGQPKTFEKGFYIHANGKIVYDLSDMEYDRFEALVGVDMGINPQYKSSISFNVIADGNTLESTEVLKHNDNMVYVSVPVKGVKELVIEVTDAGNENSMDHAVIANPKLINNNSKPTLKIENKSYKVGEVYDIKKGATASDIEDGDISSNIEVVGEVDFNKVGKYPLTYKVTDSDGNETTVNTNIAVVDMNDYNYLTDYDWSLEKHSYQKPNKDKSISGNALRLTNEDGKEVSFDRGIGAHSTSTITYDLTDKDYAYFSGYVGVDRRMYGTVGSVSFEIYVDGEKKFDSGIMNSKDAMKYFEVDINEAKELKLVVTDGKNGNGSDHATFADTKLHFVNEVKESEARKELREKIEYAKTITREMVGATNHVDMRWKNFEDAKLKAEEGLNDKNKTDEELNNLKIYLEYCISELEIKENDNSNEVVEESQAKKELREKIEYAKTITREMVGATKHADTKWKNFEDAKLKAEEGLNDKDKTDEELNNLKIYLEYCISELEIKENDNSNEVVEESQAKKELREKIEYAKTITREMVGATKHADTKWKNFEDAKLKAEEGLNDKDKTYEELNNLKVYLEYCISELEINNTL